MSNRDRVRPQQLQAQGGVLIGRVRRWRRRWRPCIHDMKDLQGTVSETRLELLGWFATDKTSEQPVGPRQPHLRPVDYVPDPTKAYSQPSHGAELLGAGGEGQLGGFLGQQASLLATDVGLPGLPGFQFIPGDVLKEQDLSWME